MQDKYHWVTNEMFDRALERICIKAGVEEIIHVPGVYECLSEYFNNEVLALLEEEKEND